MIPYRLDPAVAAVILLLAVVFVASRREDRYAEGFVEGVTRKNGHKLHSVPPVRGLRP